MKLIKHKWFKVPLKPLWKQCAKCGNVKILEDRGNGWRDYYYDKYGRQLNGLPECKTIFHNDNIKV
jgi:hypothetical protein